MNVVELEQKARWVRRTVLDKIAECGKGHIGGTYSCVDLLVSLYYGEIMNVDPKNPKWEDRDRFFIGKGHACLALYSIFKDLGMISQETFDEYGVDGGRLGGQLDVSTPGVEYNTGSLGHVLGIAAGVALAAKLDSRDYRAYAIMGDAECYEGSIWEAMIFAGEHGLDKLVGIVDRNRLSVTDVMDDNFFNNITQKVRAFDWECYDIDGHSFPEITQALEAAKNADKPVMIIANTVKGKGVSFMENGIKWHHSVPTESEVLVAREELSVGLG
jgi:transketolase